MQNKTEYTLNNYRRKVAFNIPVKRSTDKGIVWLEIPIKKKARADEVTTAYA